jgi:hypothetical protein
MDKLQKLLSLCKCGVYVTVNEHRDVYESATTALDDAAGHVSPPHIPDDVRAKMIELDTIVQVQFYPVTPIGSYSIWHYDLDAALDECLQCFEEFPLRRSGDA